MIAALSVAFGSIGTALAYFLGLFKGIPPWQLPVMLLGLMLLISGPSIILAFVKLRKRNLGPILDANGWAVNAKAKINVPFGTSLTDIAKLPPGAKVDISDRYAEKTSILPKVLVAFFLVWWVYAFLNDDEGRLYRWSDGAYGKAPVAVQKLLDEQASQQKVAKEKAEVDAKAKAEADKAALDAAKKAEAAAAAVAAPK
jgi:hypothetical protein